MIMNLFTKSFLIDIQDIQSIKNSKLITFNETTLISGQDYHPLDKVIDFLKVIKEKRVGSFFFIPLNIDDIYTIAIPLYLFSLNLKPTKIYFESILDHYDLFKDTIHQCYGFTNINENKNNEMIDKSIEEYYNLSKQYEYKNIDNEELLNEIPAEYFINMIGKNKIADKKFNNFRIFDIIEALLKVRLYLFNTGRDKEKKARETFDIFDNNDKYRYDDLLYKYPEIKDNIKDLFEYYEFNEYLPLLNKDLNEYIKLNTKMGYSAMGLFKYNKFLSSYIQSINYKIPTTIGEY